MRSLTAINCLTVLVHRWCSKIATPCLAVLEPEPKKTCPDCKAMNSLISDRQVSLISKISQSLTNSSSIKSSSRRLSDPSPRAFLESIVKLSGLGLSYCCVFMPYSAAKGKSPSRKLYIPLPPPLPGNSIAPFHSAKPRFCFHSLRRSNIELLACKASS